MSCEAYTCQFVLWFSFDVVELFVFKVKSRHKNCTIRNIEEKETKKKTIIKHTSHCDKSKNQQAKWIWMNCVEFCLFNEGKNEEKKTYNHWEIRKIKAQYKSKGRKYFLSVHFCMEAKSVGKIQSAGILVLDNKEQKW